MPKGKTNKPRAISEIDSDEERLIMDAINRLPEPREKLWTKEIAERFNVTRQGIIGLLKRTPSSFKSRYNKRSASGKMKNRKKSTEDRKCVSCKEETASTDYICDECEEVECKECSKLEEGAIPEGNDIPFYCGICKARSSIESTTIREETVKDDEMKIINNDTNQIELLTKFDAVFWTSSSNETEMETISVDEIQEKVKMVNVPRKMLKEHDLPSNQQPHIREDEWIIKAWATWMGIFDNKMLWETLHKQFDGEMLQDLKDILQGEFAFSDLRFIVCRPYMKRDCTTETMQLYEHGGEVKWDTEPWNKGLQEEKQEQLITYNVVKEEKPAPATSYKVFSFIRTDLFWENMTLELTRVMQEVLRKFNKLVQTRPAPKYKNDVNRWIEAKLADMDSMEFGLVESKFHEVGTYNYWGMGSSSCKTPSDMYTYFMVQAMQINIREDTGEETVGMPPDLTELKWCMECFLPLAWDADKDMEKLLKKTNLWEEGKEGEEQQTRQKRMARLLKVLKTVSKQNPAELTHYIEFKSIRSCQGILESNRCIRAQLFTRMFYVINKNRAFSTCTMEVMQEQQERLVEEMLFANEKVQKYTSNLLMLFKQGTWKACDALIQQKDEEEEEEEEEQEEEEQEEEEEEEEEEEKEQEDTEEGSSRIAPTPKNLQTLFDE